MFRIALNQTLVSIFLLIVNCSVAFSAISVSSTNLRCDLDDSGKLVTIRCSSDIRPILTTCRIDKLHPCSGDFPTFQFNTSSLAGGQHEAAVTSTYPKNSSETIVLEFCKVTPLHMDCSRTQLLSSSVLQVRCNLNRQPVSMQCSIDDSSLVSCNKQINLGEYSPSLHKMMIVALDKDGTTSSYTTTFSGTKSVTAEFTKSSPIVKGRNVTVYVEASAPVKLTCAVNLLETDCSSGRAIFTNLEPSTTSPYAIKVYTYTSGKQSVLTRSDVYILDDPERCATHLVNSTTQNAGNTTIIEFGSVGNPTKWDCLIDEGRSLASFSCTSPITLKDLLPGRHKIRIDPKCKFFIPRAYEFYSN